MRRTSLSNPLIWLPGMQNHHPKGELHRWPMCTKCNAPVHAYELADKGSRLGTHYAEVVARCCHGEHAPGKCSDRTHYDALRLEAEEAFEVDEVVQAMEHLLFFQVKSSDFDY